MADSGRGGFGRGFGGRGGDRGRGGRGDRGRGRGGRRGRKDEEEKWVPCTKLGRLVQQVRAMICTQPRRSGA
jgi:small subunit ribosomal protein S2e